MLLITSKAYNIDIQLGNITIDSTEKNILYTFKNHPGILLKKGTNNIIEKYFQQCLEQKNAYSPNMCQDLILKPQSKDGTLLDDKNQLIIQPLGATQNLATVVISYLGGQLDTSIQFSLTNLASYLNYDLYFSKGDFEALLANFIPGGTSNVVWYQLNFAFNPYGSFLSKNILPNTQRPINITSIHIRYIAKQVVTRDITKEKETVKVRKTFDEKTITRNDIDFDQFLTGLNPGE